MAPDGAFAFQRVIAMRTGDVFVHKNDVRHGVRMQQERAGDTESERWEVQISYGGSSDCSVAAAVDENRRCASEGDTVCQLLHAQTAHADDRLSPWRQQDHARYWTQVAARGGLGEAMVESSIEQLVSRNTTALVASLVAAVNAGELDAYYTLGQLLLAGVVHPKVIRMEDIPGAEVAGHLAAQQDGLDWVLRDHPRHQPRPDPDGHRFPQIDAPYRAEAEEWAVKMFEAAAAGGTGTKQGGGAFAMYNLGVAHLFGYGGLNRNITVAHDWFQLSGLPEAMIDLSLLAMSKGELGHAAAWEQRADRNGYVGKRVGAVVSAGAPEAEGGRDRGDGDVDGGGDGGTRAGASAAADADADGDWPKPGAPVPQKRTPQEVEGEGGVAAVGARRRRAMYTSRVGFALHCVWSHPRREGGPVPW